MIQTLNLLLGILLGSTYLYITVGILFYGHRHNSMSWILWTILDVIALYGTIKNNSDPTLVWLYVIGSAAIALASLYKKQFTWTRVELLTSILVALCLSATKFCTPSTLVWISATALTIAGIPHFIHECRKKYVTIHDGIVTSMFTVSLLVAVLAALSAKSSLILPIVGLGYWLSITVVFLFKTIKKPSTHM